MKRKCWYCKRKLPPKGYKRAHYYMDDEMEKTKLRDVHKACLAKTQEL